MSAPAYVRALELKLSTMHRDIKTLMAEIDQLKTFRPQSKPTDSQSNKSQPKFGLNGKPLVAKKTDNKQLTKTKPISKAKTPTPDILDYDLTQIDQERLSRVMRYDASSLGIKYWYAYKNGSTFLSTCGIEMRPHYGIVNVYTEEEMKEFKKMPGNPFQLHKDSIEVINSREIEDYTVQDIITQSLIYRFRIPEQATVLVEMSSDKIKYLAQDAVSFVRHPEGDKFEFRKGWTNIK